MTTTFAVRPEVLLDVDPPLRSALVLESELVTDEPG